MSDILKPIFFNTTIQTNKTMMSAVVSVSIPQITSKSLTRPINITLKHINVSFIQEAFKVPFDIHFQDKVSPFSPG